MKLKISDLPEKYQDQVKKKCPDIEVKKKGRYPSVKAEIDGHKFDSAAEGEIYWEFKHDPEVEIIKVHPVYKIIPKVIRGDQALKALHYEPDFLIKESRGDTVVEVKGLHLLKDPKYMRNRSLFLISYPHLNFLEIITDSEGKRREVFYPKGTK